MNNAGGSAVGTLETTTLNDVDLMFNNHVKSVFSITKRAMPHLKKSKGMYLKDHVKRNYIVSKGREPYMFKY